jgi:hypothetical protein
VLFLKPLGTTITMLLWPWVSQSIFEHKCTLFNKILLLCFELVTGVAECISCG